VSHGSRVSDPQTNRPFDAWIYCPFKVQLSVDRTEAKNQMATKGSRAFWAATLLGQDVMTQATQLSSAGHDVRPAPMPT